MNEPRATVMPTLAPVTPVALGRESDVSGADIAAIDLATAYRERAASTAIEGLRAAR